MIRFLAICALSMAAPAFAQSVDTGTQRLDIVGVANPACMVRAPGNASGTNANYQNISTSAGRIQITEMVNPSNAQPRASAISLGVPVICNSAHTLTVQSANGGMLRSGGNQRNVSRGGFAEFLPYELNANWVGQNARVSSAQPGGILIVSNNAGAGIFDVGLTVSSGGSPLVAGSYSDAIIIELRAAN